MFSKPRKRELEPQMDAGDRRLLVARWQEANHQLLLGSRGFLNRLQADFFEVGER